MRKCSAQSIESINCDRNIMSALAPLNDFASSSQNAPLAFCSLSGRQQGSIFVLNAAKSVLQFEAADDSDVTLPTRCLVIQGNNGVTVRTIQGEVSVNNQIQQDAWIAVGSEVSCGRSRLRLIRQTEIAAAPQLGLPNEQVATAPTDKNQMFGDEEPTSISFFGRLEPPKLDDESTSCSMTMCLNPAELKTVFEPNVYGDEDVGYIAAPRIESAPETVCSNEPSPIAAPTVCCGCDDTATAMAAASEKSTVVKLGRVRCSPNLSIAVTQPSSKPKPKPLPTDVSVQATRPLPILNWSGVEIIDTGKIDSNVDCNSYSVCWQTNCDGTEHSKYDLSLSDNVQGVILH